MGRGDLKKWHDLQSALGAMSAACERMERDVDCDDAARDFDRAADMACAAYRALRADSALLDDVSDLLIRTGRS